MRTPSRTSATWTTSSGRKAGRNPRRGAETSGVRNVSLHAILEAFTKDAARRLAADAEAGAEIEFELVAERGGSAPLYCYRPLTGRFISARLGILSALTTYAPAARAVAELDGAGRYLHLRGERRVPDDPRARAELALG